MTLIRKLTQHEDGATASTGNRATVNTSGLAIFAIVVGALMALPVLSVVSNMLRGGTSGTWAHLLSTVLPEYLLTTLWLCAGVALLTTVIGVGSAWLVTHFDFPLRRVFDWLLVLP